LLLDERGRLHAEHPAANLRVKVAGVALLLVIDEAQPIY
jgi:hypothetical protein